MASRKQLQVLCPIDFGEESDRALQYACVLTDKLGAKLTVMHAERFEPPLEFTSAQVDGLVKELEKQQQEAEVNLKGYVEPRCKLGGISYRIVDSPPVEAILDESAAIDADYIVMGTTGKSGLKRVLMGSVAEGVAVRSTVPVLAVREKSHGGDKDVHFKRILVPFDFSTASRQTLTTAASMAEAFGARLIVTHIIGPDDNEENAKQQLCEWLPNKAHATCDYDAVVRKGDPSEQIVQLATDEQADLVVLAAVHRQSLAAAVIGTVSEKVMRQAPCPVLLVPVPV